MGKPLVETSPIVEYCYIKAVVKELRKQEGTEQVKYFGYMGIVFELFDADKKLLATKSYECTILEPRETPYTVAELMAADESTTIAWLKKEYAGYPPEAV